MPEVALGKTWRQELGSPLYFRCSADSADAIVRELSEKACDSEALLYVATANLDHMRMLAQRQDFRRAYHVAAARTLDGMPLVWAARLRRRKRLNRVTGHDILEAQLRFAHAERHRFYVLCKDGETGEALTGKLQARGFMRERIRYFVPPFGFESSPEVTKLIIADIHAHETTHLIMGVGAPKSELWCHDNASRLPGVVAFCIGDAVSVSAGVRKRAPKALQRLGLEWAFRFAQEPRRLFMRYFVHSWVGLRALAREV